MIAALLGALAMGCASNAAPSAQPDPAGPLPTWEETGLPWRVPEDYLQPWQVTAACATDLAFIGTIVGATSFWGRDRAFNPPLTNTSIVLTDAQFDVERVVLGNPGQTLTLTLKGGVVPSGTMWVSGSPFPKVGKRFALALGRRSMEQKLEVNHTGSDWAIGGWIELDPRSPLPSESRLRSEWDRVCRSAEEP